VTYRGEIVDTRTGITHYRTPPCPTYAVALAIVRSHIRLYGKWFKERVA
jgi:hypothetical protein